MIRKRGENGVIILTGGFFLMFLVLAVSYFSIAYERKYAEAADRRSEFVIHVGESQGTIYDRNMRPLTNSTVKHTAVAVPSAADRSRLREYAVDKEKFDDGMSSGEPFIFECSGDTPESDAVTVFESCERYTQEQPARHIIGYLSDGKGVSGIERAYESVLRSGGENSVTYSVDGFGRVIIGDGKTVIRSDTAKSGVVLTIDSDIQQIAEECGRKLGKGAVVVTDVESGDILAMASFPEYSADELGKALDDKDSPLLNRCLCSYGVGSVFKLVTACEAVEEGSAPYRYECCGCIDVEGQVFNCHQLSGHGMQSITKAMTNSCNTYFISLSQELNAGRFRETAHRLGFGTENWLCSEIVGSSGVLPTVSDLNIPAELANFSFGQGKLTASPLQVNRLTCAVANGGELPVLRLVKGMTVNGREVADEKAPQKSEVMDRRTAVMLRQMMISAIRDNKESLARSETVTVGAKTSTAQTGRYDSSGEELCHGWITGFFPADKPVYAVTVIAEDGGYGNKAAAPVFREIAEKITEKDEEISQNH